MSLLDSLCERCVWRIEAEFSFLGRRIGVGLNARLVIAQ